MRVFKKGLMCSLGNIRKPSAFMPVFFAVIVFGAFFAGLNQADRASGAEGVRLLEEAILRAAVHSYATAGYFPESVDYIVENYGIYIDGTRYVVHYDVFAANILPVIRVFEI
ncbi:MAG: hypothetical protein LBI27_08145 [Clostridiales bacterium]|nr:hypothetical protein [Clostridiales bacterium]